MRLNPAAWLSGTLALIRSVSAQSEGHDPVDTVTLNDPSLEQKLKAVNAVGGPVLVGPPDHSEVARLEFTDLAKNDFSLSVVYSDGFKQAVSADQVNIPDSQKPTADLSRLKNLGPRRNFMQWLQVHGDVFPRLERKDFEAVSEASRDFNCIADSLGDHESNVWPGPAVSDFDELYARHGYVPIVGLDFSLQPELEKVVLFAIQPQDAGYATYRAGLTQDKLALMPGLICTHAILQQPDGSFTSKNGALERIKVLDPTELGGGDYGEPIRVYARKRDEEQVTAG
ncbi:hypothetical protein DYH09_28530 [bacterium CPR1]|nr:hypothetical protein [bacterium CPR1]